MQAWFEADMASSILKGLVANYGKLGYQSWHRPFKMASLVYEREIGGGVLSMRMQVILDSSFARPGSVPIWGGKKGEFRDWTRLNRVKICRDISLRTLADFLSWLTEFRLGAKSISSMLEKTLVHVTLMTIPHWLRYARAPTNCLGPPHTSQKGPTRRFEI